MQEFFEIALQNKQTQIHSRIIKFCFYRTSGKELQFKSSAPSFFFNFYNSVYLGNPESVIPKIMKIRTQLQPFIWKKFWLKSRTKS